VSDLEKRLDTLFRRGLIRKGIARGEDSRQPGGAFRPPLQIRFEGEEVGEGVEKCLKFRHDFWKDHIHGLAMPVGELLSGIGSSPRLRSRADEPLLATREELLFLDIETTGLAMGTGTYAFLIGTGYFTEDGFRIDQYFMRDFTEEEVLLDLFGEAAQPFRQVVTYNGRIFDLQLLRNRFVMAGMPPPLEGRADLDLLHLSRRFFRGRTVDCRLATIEREILGFRRGEDVDGALIPHLYFRYLRTGEFPELDLVLQHNCWDILSMAYLAHFFSRSLEEPFESCDLHGGAYLRIGAFLEDQGYEGDPLVERCYREAMRGGIESPDGYEAARRISLRLKRQGDHAGASELWLAMAGERERDDLFPLIELAKYHEHRRRDFRKALEYAQEAIRRLDSSDHLGDFRWVDAQKAQLRHRLSRLERRSEKDND